MNSNVGAMYNLPANYQPRLKPEYFHDTLPDSTYWQADCYRLAAHLARKVGIRRLVDIGCGTGGKLIPLAGAFDICGIDYGDNIEQCKAVHPIGQWITADLENEVIASEIFTDSVVINSDVIEHLVNPSALIQTLRNATQTAAYVLVSTPDRTRLQQNTPYGPPANKAHVREWTLDELEHWFISEGLPVKWAGWTVSYDKQPDKLHTCLLVLSKLDGAVDMPHSFEPAPQWRRQTVKRSDMLTAWMTPTPNEARRDPTNAINRIVMNCDKYLPDYGIQLVEEPDNAQLHVGHAGQGSQSPIDVAIFHGLYNTAQGSENFAVNASVIRNLKTARLVIAPSDWIADVIRRDMHLNPRIIPWGVDTDEWTPVEKHSDYVIWNKARVDNVSNPQPMLDLAARAHDVLFLTTFGEGTPNVRTVGRVQYEVMKEYVRHAAAYLSLNVETWGLGLAEALACGVPILGFRQGNLPSLIEHGVHGFMAEPGDMDGLYEGLRYCLKHREQLSANVRGRAKLFTWQRMAKQFADVFREAYAMKQDNRPHKIDESVYKVV